MKFELLAEDGVARAGRMSFERGVVETPAFMTHLVTLIVVFAMFFVGGEAIHNFALALIVGIIVATYASIYIASALTLWLKVTPADVVETEPTKERAIDAMP